MKYDFVDTTLSVECHSTYPGELISYLVGKLCDKDKCLYGGYGRWKGNVKNSLNHGNRFEKEELKKKNFPALLSFYALLYHLLSIR